MRTVSKETFLRVLKFRPQSLIGKEIIYDKCAQKIHDISLSGDYIYLDKGRVGKEWFPADSIDDPVVIDEIDLSWWDKGKIFTVKTVTEDIETLKKLIGQPLNGDHSLSLFEIVDAQNKRIAELRQYIDAMEQKEFKKP